MKAFTPYPKQLSDLYKLLEKVKHYGDMNCSFEQFNYIYTEWHKKTFPNRPVDFVMVNFRDDFFIDFLNYLANYEI